MAEMPEGWTRPRQLLTQNDELRDIQTFGWTIPAFVVQLSDGSHFNTCPSAGVCASLCYARQGKFNFAPVKQAHVAKLEWVLYDLPGWKAAMIEEIAKKKYHSKHVRIHDSGDFFSDAYLLAWLEIATASPNTIFYCYTKEVERFRRIVENRDGEYPGVKPRNFRYVFSFGGKQDRSLDEDTDRVADTFASFEEMEAAGYTTQHRSDLQAIYNDNNRVGLPMNNIPHLKKQMQGQRMSTLQKQRDLKRDTRGQPEEEREAQLKALSDPKRCRCGQLYRKAPAPGCPAWGHAVSRSADTTVKMIREKGERPPRGDKVPLHPLEALEEPLASLPVHEQQSPTP